MEPPEIVCFSHEALVKWRRERELYEAAVHSRCQESGEYPVTVRILAINTINRRRLKTFSELKLNMPVDEMANEKLVTAINQILASMMSDQIPNVHAIMSQHLKMDLKQNDVKARVLNYFYRFDELIEEYGLGIALDGNAKLKCRLLTETFCPPTLKEQVQLYQDLDPTVKISVPRVFDVIKAEAFKPQQSFDLYQSNKDRSQSRSTTQVRQRDSSASQGSSRSTPARDERRDERPSFRKRDSASAQGYLHCKGSHWVSDCPTTTEEQKKTARRLFMEKRKEGETAKMKRFISEGAELEPKHVAFNGVVTMPYYPDNGTKYNVVPRRIVEEIQQACPTVKTQRLFKAIEGQAVGGAISSNESIRLDLELITLAGKLDSEDARNDVDEKLAALANKEVVDFDLFESTVPLSFDPPDKKLITARLCELINEAVANGFPAERKRYLFEVVTIYDIWRIAIDKLLMRLMVIAHCGTMGHQWVKLYADSSLDVNEEICEHIANQEVYLTVEAFKQYREHPSHKYELLVSWEGLEKIDDSWEPIHTMHEDVSMKLQEYFDEVDDAKLHQWLLNLKNPHRAKPTSTTNKRERRQVKKRQNSKAPQSNEHRVHGRLLRGRCSGERHTLTPADALHTDNKVSYAISR
ncbi:hypothetical protein PC114_g322 [Phytophthora cactorum]|nr:hypothetical protein PC114_g322 [Phytophthora cactorum]